MKTRLFALILCCTPFALSAQDVEVASSSVREEVDRATSAVLDSLFTALTARDVDRLMRLYARGTSVLHVSGTAIIQTDTIFPHTARGLAALESFEAVWTPHSLQVLSSDVAVRTIRVTFRTTAKGQPPASSSGVQTLVLKRFPQGWRIVGDHRTMQPE